MSKRYGPFDGKWCKVEIMGHVVHIARATEVPLLDGKALRVCDETEAEPILYGLGAIFSLRWMSNEEGERLSTKREEDRAASDKAHAHSVIIGAIQKTITDVMSNRKMTRAKILEGVLALTPDAASDFDEAFDWLRPDEVDGIPGLYWMDPDGMPF